MFDGASFPKSLDEETFDEWLENGRNSKISYRYLCVIWDAFEENYIPTYKENREDIFGFDPYESSTGRESLVAAYDLFSESRII
ncbi:MAG: hypothetical protein LAT68_12155 [Cyclobacteriaceae bacterium]|nr:hypothetical protein [Cyclobacteriaceae bacterium]MCH8517070.1 hypothetical protein [Cyclobacteriaceae bacterium]